MSDVLSSALWVACTLVVWFTARPFVARYFTLLEQRPEAHEAVKIPADLMIQAAGYSEEWAKEQALQRYIDLYRQSGDWDVVRRVAAADQ